LVKVFEHVRGAAIEGGCEVGKPVEAYVEVRTNANRRFVYSTAAPCGASGRFAMRVPYAQSITGDTGALGGYLLRHGARQASVLVTESDVEEGRRIAVEGWGS
jgi:asparagine N-glycosylation enzyme membrane subunit Stt3